ncbi:MAG TPA: hypothetical protein PLI09_26365 [Candidatus Hydrogenedentes bacterium]|nr:hypothetical protein [Candidatus Hydrogenedentota bacterium]
MSKNVIRGNFLDARQYRAIYALAACGDVAVAANLSPDRCQCPQKNVRIQLELPMPVIMMFRDAVSRLKILLDNFQTSE